MKKKALIRSSLLIMGLLFSLSSISKLNHESNFISQSSPKASSEMRYIIDMFDREVEIPSQIDRLVATGAGALRYVVYMNGTDKICGVENIEREEEPDPAAEMRPYFFAHKELADLPSIGDKWGGDPELIVQATPDVVITTNEKQSADLDDLQSSLGIPVIGLIYGDLDRNLALLWEGLNITAEILGKQDRFMEFKEYIEGIFLDLEERTSDVTDSENKSCYIGGVSYRGGHGIDSTKPYFDSFELLHANNVARNVSLDHAFIDPEQLLAWDPEIIFIDGGGFALTLEDLNTGNFDTLQAVQNNEIHVLLPYNSYTANFGSILINTYYIGKVLYPSQFEDININETAASIYENMVGADVLSDMVDAFQFYAQTSQNPLDNYNIDDQNKNNISGYPLVIIGLVFGIFVILKKQKSKN